MYIYIYIFKRELFGRGRNCWANGWTDRLFWKTSEHCYGGRGGQKEKIKERQKERAGKDKTPRGERREGLGKRYGHRNSRAFHVILYTKLQQRQSNHREIKEPWGPETLGGRVKTMLFERRQDVPRKGSLVYQRAQITSVIHGKVLQSI